MIQARMRMLTREVIKEITKGYSLPLTGVHGPAHWGRVLVNARRLAVDTGADTIVIELFAILHDSRRLNEGHDPGHGSRAADLARSLLSKDGHVGPERLRLLEEACRLHTKGLREGDVTIQTCWDADRLDLFRVGTRPVAELLCTQAAKDPAMIAWANERAGRGDVPALIREEWGGCGFLQDSLDVASAVQDTMHADGGGVEGVDDAVGFVVQFAELQYTDVEQLPGDGATQR